LLLALAAASSLCVLVAGAAANAFTVAPLTLVTGPSPYAGCSVGAAPGSVLYPNAEEEPWIDVNPTNPNNLIAVWQQDRWNDGGAHGLVTGVSHDGGATWHETFAHFSTCAGGTAANGGNARAQRPSPLEEPEAIRSSELLDHLRLFNRVRRAGMTRSPLPLDSRGC